MKASFKFNFSSSCLVLALIDYNHPQASCLDYLPVGFPWKYIWLTDAA